MKRLDRDQRLVVVHAERRVVICARAGMEHRVGGMRTGDSPALGRKRSDCRLDDLDLLGAELAAFAGVRVEAGDGEPRFGEYRNCAADREAPRGRAIRSARCVSCERDLGKRQVRGDRHRPQRRAGEHHHDIGGETPQRSATNSVWPGMLEADRIKLLLGDRPGDDGGRRAGSGEPDGDLERIERAMRAGDARMARRVGLRRR